MRPGDLVACAAKGVAVDGGDVLTLMSAEQFRSGVPLLGMPAAITSGTIACGVGYAGLVLDDQHTQTV
jgi:hypothetical protein